jgi:hypothetical protein
VAIDVELRLHDVAEIDRRRDAGRHLHAAHRLVAGEVRAVGDVAKVAVGADPAGPQRQVGRRIDGERDRIAGRDVDLQEQRSGRASAGAKRLR